MRLSSVWRMRWCIWRRAVQESIPNSSASKCLVRRTRRARRPGGQSVEVRGISSSASRSCMGWLASRACSSVAPTCPPTRRRRRAVPRSRPAGARRADALGFGILPRTRPAALPATARARRAGAHGLLITLVLGCLRCLVLIRNRSGQAPGPQRTRSRRHGLEPSRSVRRARRPSGTDLQAMTEPRHVGTHRARGGLRRLLPPQRVDQRAQRHLAALGQQQHREHGRC